MKTGLSRLMSVVSLPLILTLFSCQETQQALPSEDAVDGILDLLDSVSVQAELPAASDPTLTITDPAALFVNLQLATPVTPMTVSFLVTNWTFPAAGRSVDWYLDGVLVASQTEAGPVVIPDIPMGAHKICGSLVADGKRAPYCAGTDCFKVDVKRPCGGYGDPICKDGNPCSQDACISIGGGKFECRYINTSGCCNSSFDCTCSSGKWEVCNPATAKCAPCAFDTDCEDGEPCTVDTCSNGTCSNAWTFINGAKCCSPDSANPNAGCNDGKFCTTDYCDLGAGVCVNTPSANPLCCETRYDPICNDQNVCTTDLCVSNVCRYSSPTAGCCNTSADCNDSNPCTNDVCTVDNKCVYEPNNLANCCNVHPDCTTGGAWDDGKPETIDYCQNNQCQHVFDPDYCDASAFPCLDDGDACTQEVCLLNKCRHNAIPGCCDIDADCDDKIFCSMDVCVNGFCDNSTRVPGCCDIDADCNNNNPCDLDNCVNHACRYATDKSLPNCCLTDADCNDGSACTVEYCNTGVATCERQLVPNQTPKCCWTKTDCDDADPYTLEQCDKNTCKYIANPNFCNEQNPSCDDLDPCTTDTCNFATNKCGHAYITNCCVSDLQCQTSIMSDGNPCTYDKCDMTTHKCYFPTISQCCTGTQPGECDDGNVCTTDSCVAYSCRHVRAFPGCCAVMEDCNDGNECTNDFCDQNSNTCVYTVNTALADCCLTQGDCNDNNPCSNDYCIENRCGHSNINNCCQTDIQCDDGNLCTCDRCIYGACRYQGPATAGPGCGLPPICCNTAADCQSDNNVCTLEQCVNGNCLYVPVDPCSRPLPFVETFNSCTSDPKEWVYLDLGAKAEPNWRCAGLGPLGPDVHMHFDWLPEILAPFSTFLVTPAIDGSTATIATVQFERVLDFYQDSVDLGLYVIKDVAAPVGTVTVADSFFPLSVETYVTDAEQQLVSFVIPQQYLIDRTYVGFQIASAQSYNVTAFEMDNVKVCAGTVPTFTTVPADQVLSVGKKAVVDFYVRDTDANQVLTTAMVEGPVFATVISTTYDNARSEWRVRLELLPTLNTQIGDHTVRLRVSDGCLDALVSLKVKVLLSSGYLVWKASGTRSSHSEALASAIAANNRPVQIVEDLSIFSDLSGFSGIFVSLGVYGAKHVLLSHEASRLSAYLADGGRVYMEGGDTWSNDPATVVHGRFGIVGVDDGVQNYPGPANGRHFCYGLNFNVSSDFTLNNFVDRIDYVLGAGAVPLVRGNTGDHSLVVARTRISLPERTIGASLPFAALVNGASTRNALMAKYIAFFENGWPACSQKEHCDDSQLCTIDSCGDDGKCVNQTQTTCIMCSDDTQCPDGWACRVASQVCGKIPGDEYPAVDTPIDISAVSGAVYENVIQISESQLVKDVHVQVKLQHSYSGDLKISLTHMGKTVILKTNNPAAFEPNHYFTYDFGTSVFSGSPIKLDAFNGMAMVGDWVLTVQDTAPLSGGQLVDWSLFIVYDVPPCSAAEPDVCDDENVCTLDSCDTAAGYCLFEENPCTDFASGQPNLCTTDSCDPSSGCIHAMKDCDDGDLCTADACNTVTGECVHPKIAHCVKPCAKHSECGFDDYCEPINAKCTPIPGDAFHVAGGLPVAIPDNGMDSISSNINSSASGHVLGIYVKVFAKHPYRGDLTMRLTNGTHTLFLHNQSGGALDNVDAVYGLVEAADGPGALSAFAGDPATSTWTLQVKDWASGDSGTLDTWSLYVVRSICFKNEDCDDFNACTVDVCDTLAPGGKCNRTPVNCNDGSWCNGEESCSPTLGCIPGVPVIINDSVACTTDLCDEATQTIKHTPQNALCDDGLWCNGLETCHATFGCQSGPAPVVDDAIMCTTDLCDEIGDTVQHIAIDSLCANVSFCDGEEVCDPDLGCVPGPLPNVDDGIDCTLDECDEGSDLIRHLPVSSLCSDGRWCTGPEFCDVQLGCMQGAAPEIDDGLPCTQDICMESPAQVVHIPDDTVCDDLDWCNGTEVCGLFTGCVVQPAPDLDDGIDCTVDTCVSSTQEVLHEPDDVLCDDLNPCTTDSCDPGFGCRFVPNDLACDDGELCTSGDQCQAGECVPGGPNLAELSCIGCNANGCPDDGNMCNGFVVCDAGTGVCLLAPGSVVKCPDTGNECAINSCDPLTGECAVQNRPEGFFCSDGDLCTGPDRCDGNGLCVGSPSICDDGAFCNGVELCDPLTGSCSQGVAPPIDDGLACTMDVCDEINNVVLHTPNDYFCSDGLFCTGVEVCDAVQGCLVFDVPTIDDGIDCTFDMCDENVRAVIHTPNHAACDDGLWCTGQEVCTQGVGCQHVNQPPVDDGVACTLDSCDEDSDTVVHAADHMLCSDGDDCNGIEVCKLGMGCAPGIPPVIDDGVSCTIDSCENGVLSHIATNALCDDGLWCNGDETCSETAGCVPGASPVLDDGVSCTVDFCDEASDSVSHVADDNVCNNNLYCDGEEYCDIVQGCIVTELPTCDDGNPCSVDLCNPALASGLGACDNTTRVQYCQSKCGGTHAYNAGDNVCGYDDACVGGTAGAAAGNCKPVCSGAFCAKAESGTINALISDSVCISRSLTLVSLNPFITGIDVKVEVLHTFIGDLKMSIKTPEGTWIPLWLKGTGGDNDHMYNTFNLSYNSADFCPVLGQAANGVYTLEICDEGAGNTGSLLAWKLFATTSDTRMNLGDSCEAPISLSAAEGTTQHPGTTRCATNLYSSSCGGGSAAERVYQFSIAQPTKVVFNVLGGFDSILSLRAASGATCADTAMLCKDATSTVSNPEVLKTSLSTPGTYYLIVDGAPGQVGDYVLTTSFFPLKVNGSTCGEDDECLSNRCNNGYCCGAGTCCSVASNCPQSFTQAPTCDSRETCQGTREEATCVDFQCGSLVVDDDSGCEGEIADDCGCYKPKICTAATNQLPPVCPTTCSSAAQCDTNCHCGNGCEPDLADGESCTNGDQCQSGHCEAGICCASGHCCRQEEHCNISLYTKPAACDSPGTCQGTRKERRCSAQFQCYSELVPDDTACGPAVPASDCGCYPTKFCTGAADQPFPTCASSCSEALGDTQCDSSCHCDGVCLADLVDGLSCDESSDCVSSYCANGYCCDSGGVNNQCCNTAASCPASFRLLATCDNSQTCQGHRVDATCASSICGSNWVNDDSGCTATTLALDCGLFKSIYCQGITEQTAPECPTTCADDSECDDIAHCDETCVLDVANGEACNEASDCISGHCQNGFCCNEGDCCALADHCPASYLQPPTCSDPGTCQGFRKDKRCENFMCDNQPIADDTACTTGVLANACDCFKPLYCTGAMDQPAPECPTSCAGDGDCDENCHCEGSCVPNLPLGSPCDEDKDCYSLHCADGVCCDTTCSGSCEACNIAGLEGTCSAHQADTDPEDECGLCTVCNGSRACQKVPSGLDPLDQCAGQDASTCRLDGECDGAGACRNWNNATQCAGGYCVGAILYPPDLCNGLGVCIDAAAKNCGSYMCNPDSLSCRTECTQDSHCSPGFWCGTAGTCLPKVNQAQPCGPEFAYGNLGEGDSQCKTNHCQDGVCCDKACDADCMACNLPSLVGVCTNHPPLSDPEDDCTLCNVCSGTGSCTLVANGADPVNDCAQVAQSDCGQDGMCDGIGACRLWLPDTVCVVQSCVGQDGGMADYQVNADLCNGTGSCIDYGTTPCYPYVCDAAWGCFSNCNNNSQCAPDSFCLGSECLLKKENGVPCAGNNYECQSDHCVDGYCCDTSCEGECQACNIEGVMGVCTGHTIDTDPEDDCPSCFICNGSSQCVPVGNGFDPLEECSADNQATCQKDGTCDGAGACRLWLPETVCLAQSCSGRILTFAFECNGAGSCNHQGVAACDPYVCDAAGGACRTFCTGNQDCVDGFWCNDSQECVPKFDIGVTCLFDYQCLTDFCVDGYCCDEACTDDCVSCALAGNEGTCSLHAANSDPDNDCETCHVCSGVDRSCTVTAFGIDPVEDCNMEATSSCGLDGTCDGAGACHLWALNTICIDQYCTEHVKRLADRCDGSGLCTDTGLVDCTPYQCNDAGLDCRTTCADDTHCLPTYWCNTDSSTCMPKMPNGDQCTAGNQCQSSFCTDGVCCNVACNGECKACNLAGKEGACVMYDNDTDPEVECGLCGICNGAGACRAATDGTDPKSECAKASESTCDFDGECDGNKACRFWNPATICVAVSCSAFTKYPADFCSGDGNCVDSGEVSCVPYVCNDAGNDCRSTCTLDVHCTEGYYCGPLNTCVLKKLNGVACGAGRECASDFCVDGVCCNTGCDSLCHTCSTGTCSPIAAATDPEFECPSCQVCDGSGACTPVAAGIDTKNNCNATPETSCGLDGHCDGAGACRKWVPSTICVAQMCLGFTLHKSDYCSGSGSCLDSGTLDCSPYVCAGDAQNCRTGCENDTHCQSAFYCLGNVCVVKKTNGTTCAENRECSSGFCVDGYCCNTACNSDCESCNQTGKLGACTAHAAATDPEDDCTTCMACSGATATCVLVGNGLDPVNDCTELPASTCQTDGTCNGAGTCRLWLPSTVCLAQFCMDALVHNADTCSGGGACTDNGTVSCAPYQCAADEISCRTFCSTDAHCVSGFYCNAANQCVPKKAVGQGCGANNQCVSTFCVDGYCCDSSCTNNCMNCALPGFVGTCKYFANNEDPENECGLCGVCNGAGLCRPASSGTDPKSQCAQADATSCDFDGECNGAYACRFWNTITECVPQSCSDHVRYPADLCSGTGDCLDSGTADCEPYKCNGTGTDCLYACQSDVDCMSAYWCQGATCVAKKPNGDACGGANECTSGFCADGVCCNRACVGTCENCALEGAVGTCTRYAPNTDPELECGLCNVCSGSGTCVLVPAGSDPLAQCEESDVSGCAQDGTCNGTGGCRLWLPTSICVQQFCDNNTEHAPDYCSGSGSCLDSGDTPCEPYVCDGDGISCLNSCVSDTDCQIAFWCNGNVCESKFTNGTACQAGRQCLSGNCVDGYCCNTACSGTCLSCAIVPGSCSGYSLGTDPENECTLCKQCNGLGACILVAAGQDPVGDCALEPESTCSKDGTCDGSGACRLWASATVCLPQFCDNGVEHADDTCDGLGTCDNGGTTLCHPYVCKDTFECLHACTGDEHCVLTHYCKAGACVEKKALGEECTAANQCYSNQCVDGYCCNTACNSGCQACDIAGAEGLCTYHANDSDPEGECALCKVCNGGGSCKNATDGSDVKLECTAAPASTCQLDGACNGTGACRLWNDETICVVQACVGATKYPADYCSGTGSCVDAGTVNCCPYLCAGADCRNSCTTNAHCCGTAYCSGSSCVAKKGDGSTCSEAFECSSGNCVDGYCCNEACTGTCRSCALPTKQGTCSNYGANLDPERECPKCRVCDGSGFCKPATAGTDIKDECTDAAPESCGLDGECNGSSACRYWDNSVVCVQQSCVGTTRYPADKCSGAGACVDTLPQSCCPYVCNPEGTGCRTGCTGDGDCCGTYWCNSGSCIAKKANGQTCGGSNECTSGYCVDGYCCNTACNLGCESCATNPGTCTFRAANTDVENDCPVCKVCSGTGNTCVFAAAGADPAEDCTAASASTCGLDGLCDGTGACRRWVSGTVCVSQYCVAEVTYFNDTCTGTGTCTDNGSLGCNGYVCDDAGVSCRTTCSEDAHCNSSYYCSGGSCVLKKGNGISCTAGNQCSSSFCVDGYCCNTVCDGSCQSCKQAGSLGSCTNVSNNQDPDNECGFCGVCSGGGACKPATAGTDLKSNCTQQPETGCGFDGACDGNFQCRFWNTSTVCVNSFCSADRFYYNDLCSGAGSCVDAGSVSCSPYKCSGTSICKTSCVDDNDCFTGFFCSGNVCVAKKANGNTCTAANQCSSNFCKDGYCCNVACTGACQACNVSGKLGTCTNHASGADPEAECGLCKTCNGAGACASAAEGTDPKNQCEAVASTTCGLDGWCNGAGACRHWPGGTVCSTQTCSVDVLGPTDYCDGAGTCIGSSSSCTTLGWSDAGGSQWVCGSDSPCAGLVTYAQAQQLCSTRGGRLCTWAEVEAGEVANGTCGYNTQRIWSLSECAENQHYTGAGAPAGLGAVPKQCTADTATAYVACCSDDFSCCPYKCSGSGCATSCGANTDCCNGFFCEGGACIQTKPAGQTCQFNFQCASGNCVDGYCCNNACNSGCEACNIVGHVGTCWPHAANLDPDNDCPTCYVCDGNRTCVKVAVGSDPVNDCAADDVTTCDQDGACDGNGACRLWNTSTVCESATCSGTTFYNADTCSGTGTCSDKGTISCCPYQCNGTSTACRGTCSLDTHCCNTAYCASPSCVPKKANGQACGGPNQCTSGFCVDNVCCDVACTGTCQGCAVSGSVGTCTNFGNGTDLTNECGLCKVCNGAGSCTNVGSGLDPKDQCTASTQAACGLDGGCNGSGACAFWNTSTMCVAESCTGNTYYKPDYCSGAGACSDKGTIDCCPYKCGATTCKSTCSVDTDCCATAYCGGTTCTNKKGNGTACGRDGECTSGYCTDGVCCAGRCNEECKSCNLTGTVGACTNIPANQDPVDECGSCRVCNGSGACAYVPNNSDPLNECATESPCGLDGVCNGAGSCRKYASGYACSTQTCTDSTKYLVDTCNGTGTCVDAGSSSCCPYKCGTTDCLTTCSTSANCCSTHYCSGNACVVKKVIGAACGSAGECASGFCADGVCCNSACLGSCENCAKSGTVGTCTKHALNTDPDNECGLCRVCNSTFVCASATAGTDPMNECSVNGCVSDGMCDGGSACRKTALGTVCLAASCSGSTYYKPDECDGLGNCIDKGTQACNPYYCAGAACASNCGADTDCVAGYYCNASVCTLKKTQGQACNASNECGTGYCVDNVCCENACTGQCKACNVSPGYCTFIANNSDPGLECAACWVCDGNGACKFATAGQDPKNNCADQGPCANNGACDGGGGCQKYSNTTVCVTQTCPAGGSVRYPDDKCNGTGTCVDTGTASCCPYMCGTNNACLASCTTDTQCCDGSYCNGSQCVTKLAQGQNCGRAGECASGFCVDGRCCNNACNALCQSCNQTGKEGTCTNFASGTDVFGECGFCKACNGGTACRDVLPTDANPDPKGQCAPDGTTCGLNGNCNGSGGCGYVASGTPCVLQSCTAPSTLNPARFCNGSGICATAAPGSCNPYKCADASGCRTSCTLDTHCIDGYYCLGTSCVQKKANGQPCTVINECSSGFCADGYCCDSACNTTCKQCNKTGYLGSCQNVADNTDPKNSCTKCLVCNGTGACRNVLANNDPVNDCDASAQTTCGLTGNCSGSGSCSYWPAATPCSSETCSVSTWTYAKQCNGSGTCAALTPASQSCCPHLCGASNCLNTCSSDSAHCCSNAICKKGTLKCETCTAQTKSSPCTGNLTTSCCGGTCSTPIWINPNTGGRGASYSFNGSTYGSVNSTNIVNHGGTEPDRTFAFNLSMSGSLDEGAYAQINLRYQTAQWPFGVVVREGSCTGTVVGGTDRSDCGNSAGGCTINFYAKKNVDYYLTVDGVGAGQSGDFTMTTTFYSICSGNHCSCLGADYGEVVDPLWWKNGFGTRSTEESGYNPVDCRPRNDFVGNASQLNLYNVCTYGHCSVDYNFSVPNGEANLAGARDDWRTSDGYERISCPAYVYYGIGNWPPVYQWQDGVDHMLVFQVTSPGYVWIRAQRVGGWGTGRWLRMVLNRGAAKSDMVSPTKLVCTDEDGSGYASYGNPNHSSTWPNNLTWSNMWLDVGWYFLIIDQNSGTFQDSMPTESSGQYRVWVTIFPNNAP